MNVLGTQYTLKYKSFEIYLSGCSGSPHCPGCHNPESWDFSRGDPLTDDLWTEIDGKIKSFGEIIKNIMVFGGEPLDQDHEQLKEFLNHLSRHKKQIWLFTRYEISEIPEFVKLYCDYIKSGRFDRTKLTDDNVQYGIKLATSNQKIYKKGIDY